MVARLRFALENNPLSRMTRGKWPRAGASPIRPKARALEGERDLPGAPPPPRLRLRRVSRGLGIGASVPRGGNRFLSNFCRLRTEGLSRVTSASRSRADDCSIPERALVTAPPTVERSTASGFFSE